jgi:hypothetical protein
MTTDQYDEIAPTQINELPDATSQNGMAGY